MTPPVKRKTRELCPTAAWLAGLTYAALIQKAKEKAHARIERKGTLNNDR